jgi:hypothetical protein
MQATLLATQTAFLFLAGVVVCLDLLVVVLHRP